MSKQSVIEAIGRPPLAESSRQAKRWRYLAVGLAGALVAIASGGIAWYCFRYALSNASVAENVSKPAVAVKLAWPATIGEYEFLDPQIRGLATKCDGVARRVYSNLTHDNYDDVKLDVVPEAIVARWYVADANGRPVPATKALTPMRSGSIHLSHDGSGKISDVILIGDARSDDGWAASIQYSARFSGRFHINIFGSPLPRDANGWDRIDLVNPTLRIENLRTGERNVSLSLESVLFTPQELSTQHIADDGIAPFFGTAESMRDESLKRLDWLEAKIQQQIRAGAGFTETDWSDVRSDNPPREMRRVDGPLAEDVEKACIERVAAFIDRRRTVIKEHYRSVHQAVLSAFPFVEVMNPATDPSP